MSMLSDPGGAQKPTPVVPDPPNVAAPPAGGAAAPSISQQAGKMLAGGLASAVRGKGGGGAAPTTPTAPPTGGTAPTGGAPPAKTPPAPVATPISEAEHVDAVQRRVFDADYRSPNEVAAGGEKLPPPPAKTPPAAGGGDAPATSQQGWGNAWNSLMGGNLSDAWGQTPGYGKALLGAGGGALLMMLLSKLFGKQGSYTVEQIKHTEDVFEKLSTSARARLYGEAQANPELIEKIASCKIRHGGRSKRKKMASQDPFA